MELRQNLIPGTSLYRAYTILRRNTHVAAAIFFGNDTQVSFWRRLWDRPSSARAVERLKVYVRRILSHICDITCIPVKVTLRQMNMAMTNCCGNLCDSIDMKSSDGTWKSSCPCFVVSKGIGSIVFDLNFSVKTPQGASFEVLRFTSRSFTGLLTRNGFPSSINVEQIEKAGADYLIYSQLEQRIQNINDNGGFGILGWIRIGLKNDVSSAEGLKVRSSDMVRHVTRMRAHNALPFSTNKLINVEEILTEATRPTLPVASAKTADKSNLDDTSKQPSLPAASAERAGKSNLDDDSKETAEFV